MADASYGGIRKRKRFKSEDIALRWEKAVRQADLEGLPFPNENDITNGPTLRAFVDTYFNSIWPDLKEGASVKNAAAQIRHCIETLEQITPDIPLVEVDAKSILMMETMMMATKPISQSTLNRKRSAISKVLKFALQKEFIDKKPHISFSKEKGGRERILSYKEEEKFFDYLNHCGLIPAIYLSQFLLYTGARLSEATSLDWPEVTKNFSHITFLGAKSKGHKARTIPCASKAREALEFSKKRGDVKPFIISQDTYRGHFDRARGHLGFLDDKEFVPHMFRHTCASRLAMADISLVTIQEWMGHKNITTTQRYAHLIPESLNKGVAALERTI